MIDVTGSIACVHKEKGNAANVAFGNQIAHWSELSFDFLRCRRLISPRMAVTINCASVSCSSLTSSISLRTSRGTLAVFCCDLLLTVPVAITGLLMIRWCSVYGTKKIKKVLKCKSPRSMFYLEGDFHLESGETHKCYQHLWASNHNVSWSNIMACSHDTQIRPEFTYLFLGTPSDKPNTTPVVLRVEANTEQQACSHFLNWNLVFAAQIRTKAPYRLQLMDGADCFSWIFEQLPDVCTSGVQEVAYV
ncbi:host cell division inhibitor Icd-like protein [Salmonella enterica]|nr:host cell division inhibitor Icd-like protein [Salmonella enterica]EAV6399971.1 host cell division inhibitor Icd-like protein [Salmonella enterica]EAY4652428.1 host cell division inhibitor Icd-like protein [Salmonella enterica]EBC0575075.1 host cell division inhibitor Icd-like protein [Salmonella enterica]EBM3809411.1 host cell division inhibitor Icd-like protein [Salmonella enterica]